MKVTVKQIDRFGGYGLAILVTYSVFGPQKVIDWIKRHIVREFEIVKNDTERSMI